MTATANAKRARVLWAIFGVVVALAVLIIAARWFRFSEAGAEFIGAYSGSTEPPAGTPVGIAPWLAWQHYLNAFFIVLIMRSGLKFRSGKRPDAFFVSRRVKPGERPRRISIDIWLHQSIDLLWFVNGVVFVVLLFVTGGWMRIVPTTWLVLPNAVSAAVQYLSLDWPMTNGWVNYNSLQQLAYFATVFIAAPLAAISGLRLSTLWPMNPNKPRRYFTEGAAKIIHWPVMVYFVAFIVVHVGLVLSTGARRNLNHMFGANDGESWFGVVMFALALISMVLAWFAVRASVLKPVAKLFGEVK